MAIHDPRIEAAGPYPVPLMESKAEPTLKNPEAESFYAEALQELNKLGLPFLLAGTYALSAYTGIAARPRISTSSARPATTRASSRISRISAMPSRSRTTAGSARSIGPALLRRDLRLLERHDADRRPMVRECAPDRSVRLARARSSDRRSSSGRSASSSFATAMTARTWRTPSSRRTTRSIGVSSSATWKCIGRCCSRTSSTSAGSIRRERDDVPRWMMDELLDRLASSSTFRRRR